MNRWLLGMLGVIVLAQGSMWAVLSGHPLAGFGLAVLAGVAGGLYAIRADVAASYRK
jgi:drug/metabolite transporter (DMT)-like permease